MDRGKGLLQLLRRRQFLLSLSLILLAAAFLAPIVPLSVGVCDGSGCHSEAGYYGSVTYVLLCVGGITSPSGSLCWLTSSFFLFRANSPLS